MNVSQSNQLLFIDHNIILVPATNQF